MRILIAGIYGFVGYSLVKHWRQSGAVHQLIGVDNLSRAGSEINRQQLRQWGVPVYHADIRCPSDLQNLPDVDWVIDAAANPSVMAGIDGASSSRQVMEHNLVGTINMLEFCRDRKAGFLLLSTSRVFSIEPLSKLKLTVENDSYKPTADQSFPIGASVDGIDETFLSRPPLSLYGAAKAASEILALEYSATFNIPVWINRCGILAGAGQFGHAEQGIFSYWVHTWNARRPLKYIGFGGAGHQVRDAMHPRDLAAAIDWQLDNQAYEGERIFNLAGGVENATSLRQLSDWCENRFGKHVVTAQPEQRSFDVPWLVLNSSRARDVMGWRPTVSLEEILDEIAQFAAANPRWLDLCQNTGKPSQQAGSR